MHLKLVKSSAVGGRVPFNLPQWADKTSGPIARDLEVQTAVDELIRPSGGRVAVKGMPGVGKDVVALAALSHNDVRARALHSFTPKWLPATTVSMLCANLQQLGIDHLGVPFSGEKQEVVLERVKDWLAANDGWQLYVEDLCLEASEVLKRVLSSTPSGRGMVIVTTTEDLSSTLPDFWPLSLGLFTIAQSRTLLDKMGLKSRVEGGDPTQAQQVDAFLDIDLGNLPLPVSLFGQMLRSEASSTPVLDLMKEHREIRQEAIAMRGQNLMEGRAAGGLAASVRLALNKLDGRVAGPEQRLTARAAFAALSVLSTAAPVLAFGGMEDAPGAIARALTNVGFEEALGVLCGLGLVERGSGGYVKTHRQVQLCARQELVL